MSKERRIRNVFELHVLPKLKFALTSSVATLVDYILYVLLSIYLFPPVTSNIISQGTGMIINFILQKRYVFILQRKVNAAFILSITFSLIGIGIGSMLVWFLTRYEFFLENPYITKIIVTGIIFFYNFYTKRFAFEKRLSSFKSV